MNSSQDPRNDLQLQLAAAYQHLTALYGEATKIAISVRDGFANGDDGVGQTNELRKIMDSIQEVETSVRPMRKEWDSSKASANAELRNAVDQLTKAINQMIGPIDEAERLATAARDRRPAARTPGMNSRNMQAAYSAAKLEDR